MPGIPREKNSEALKAHNDALQTVSFGDGYDEVALRNRHLDSVLGRDALDTKEHRVWLRRAIGEYVDKLLV